MSPIVINFMFLIRVTLLTCGTLALKRCRYVDVDITVFYNVKFMMLELVIKICILINGLL